MSHTTTTTMTAYRRSHGHQPYVARSIFTSGSGGHHLLCAARSKAIDLTAPAAEPSAMSRGGAPTLAWWEPAALGERALAWPASDTRHIGTNSLGVGTPRSRVTCCPVQGTRRLVLHREHRALRPARGRADVLHLERSAAEDGHHVLRARERSRQALFLCQRLPCPRVVERSHADDPERRARAPVGPLERVPLFPLGYRDARGLRRRGRLPRGRRATAASSRQGGRARLERSNRRPDRERLRLLDGEDPSLAKRRGGGGRVRPVSGSGSVSAFGGRCFAGTSTELETAGARKSGGATDQAFTNGRPTSLCKRCRGGSLRTLTTLVTSGRRPLHANQRTARASRQASDAPPDLLSRRRQAPDFARAMIASSRSRLAAGHRAFAS